MKPTRTETIVREYDQDGRLIAETVHVVTRTPIPLPPDDRPGPYL